MRYFLNLSNSKIFTITIIIGLFLISSIPVKGQPKSNKPNVIFIYADDLGRGMLSCYGQKQFQTPNIDRIAANGLQFMRIYGGHYCAPSRASLLTGLSDVTPNKWKVTKGSAYTPIATKATTIQEVQVALDKINDINYAPQTYLAEVFKKAGYVTGQIGKLEYGFSTSFAQMKRDGWDYYYGYLDHNMCHGFYPPFLVENEHQIDIPGNTMANSGLSQEPETPAAFEERWNRNGKAVYAEDLFMYKVRQFINQNKNNPFFLFFPTTLPHGPVAIPAINPEVAFNDKLTSIEKEYASMVLKLDDDVGKILNQLEALHLLDNTILVFGADNGHQIYYAQKGRIEKPGRDMTNGQLFNNITTKWYSDIGGDRFNGNNDFAGLKTSNWEGGVRVPLLMMWGKKIKPKKTNAFVSNYDFLPTMANLVNIKVSEKKSGISYLPLLYNKPITHPHQYITNASFMGPQIVTADGWKLRYYAPKKIFQLYYLPKDYQERYDVIDKNEEVATRLKKQLLAACEGDLNNGWYRGY